MKLFKAFVLWNFATAFLGRFMSLERQNINVVSADRLNAAIQAGLRSRTVKDPAANWVSMAFNGTPLTVAALSSLFLYVLATLFVASWYLTDRFFPPVVLNAEVVVGVFTLIGVFLPVIMYAVAKSIIRDRIMNIYTVSLYLDEIDYQTLFMLISEDDDIYKSLSEKIKFSKGGRE